MKRSVGAAVVAVVTVLSLVGCTIDRGSDDRGADQGPEAQAAVVEKLPPVVSVEDGATEVSPAVPVVVKAADGELAEVVMKNQDGKVVKGELAADKKSWTTAEVLGYYRTYTLTATDTQGNESVTKFSTMAPAGTATVRLSPYEGANVGVGQTIGMRFSTPITNRKAAQDAITVTTEPKVEGAFYWLNDYELRWRPENYWQPGTTVTVDAKLYGTDLGGGIYGGDDNATSFTIVGGYSAEVDDNTKIMTIYDGANVVKTMPVSLGSSKWPTPHGIYVVGDEYPEMIMDSESFGLSMAQGGYKTPVKYATQLSYSGIFVHAAPWSVWAQGSQNTSHGCVNVSTDNAAWFQENFKRGDVVTIVNTIGGPLSGYDGLGDWNIPWSEWSKGNAN